MSCREFPDARPAYWEAPETLRPKWVFTSGETEVRGMWVFSPAETQDARKMGVSPGETVVARKTGVPRTCMNVCLHVYECIIELLLYTIGLSANSQEALSRALGAR